MVEAARLKTVPDSEKMDYFKSMISDKERMEYGEDRFAEGRAEGLAEGLAEGARKKQIEIACKMVNEYGQSPEIAAAITGLQTSDFMES